MEIVIDEHMLCLVGRSVVCGWALQGVGIVCNIGHSSSALHFILVHSIAHQLLR